jgi:hypothetical protein
MMLELIATVLGIERRRDQPICIVALDVFGPDDRRAVIITAPWIVK